MLKEICRLEDLLKRVQQGPEQRLTQREEGQDEENEDEANEVRRCLSEAQMGSK